MLSRAKGIFGLRLFFIYGLCSLSAIARGRFRYRFDLEFCQRFQVRLYERICAMEFKGHVANRCFHFSFMMIVYLSVALVDVRLPLEKFRS